MRELVAAERRLLVIESLRVGVRALAVELADVRAGDEGPRAGSGQCHHTNAVVCREVVQNLGEPAPHLDGHRVVLLGLVERYESDAGLPVGQHLAACILHVPGYGTTGRTRPLASVARTSARVRPWRRSSVSRSLPHR